MLGERLCLLQKKKDSLSTQPSDLATFLDATLKEEPSLPETDNCCPTDITEK